MELMSTYFNNQETRKPQLTLMTTSSIKKEEGRQVVDLGDLIERIKIQIDSELKN